MSESRQTRRLKRKEIAAYRKKLLLRQRGLCALCGLRIPAGQETLDHDHKSGHCRAVLHRQCNGVEGRINNWLNRLPQEVDKEEFLAALLEYRRGDYTHYAVHPNHRTEQEREIRRLRRHASRLKTERGKQRIRDKIKEIQSNDR